MKPFGHVESRWGVRVQLPHERLHLQVTGVASLLDLSGFNLALYLAARFMLVTAIGESALLCGSEKFR